MRYISGFVLLVFLAGCGKTPYTNRTQFIIMSQGEEMSLGASEAQKIKQSSKISTDKALQNKISAIGNRIAAVSGRSDFDWDFTVIDEDIPNAFCLPGGKVFFYTGILKITQNDDQIATIMGHEIAHALARHGAERMSMQTAAGVGGQLLIGSLGAQYQGLAAQAFGVTSQVGLILPYSRKFEHEADEIGIVLMHKAGYNPNEALKFWQNMAKLSAASEKPPAFLSTHPADEARIAAIKKQIENLR